MIKIIAAIIGYVFFRFPGAVLGYFIGSIFDRSSGNRGGFQAIFQQDVSRVSPADFELNLLSLASLVIKADGKVSQSEMDFVRRYFVQAYGKERANAVFKTFNDLTKENGVSAQQVCQFLKQRTPYESRLQIIHFLFSIANADGYVTESEVSQIQRITTFLSINYRDFESIKAMFFKNPDSAYKILEIESSAKEPEIKKAYRSMVKKYHPDKLVHMDAVYRKGAEEKFRRVQEAYEQIQKERGF